MIYNVPSKKIAALVGLITLLGYNLPYAHAEYSDYIRTPSGSVINTDYIGVQFHFSTTTPSESIHSYYAQTFTQGYLDEFDSSCAAVTGEETGNFLPITSLIEGEYVGVFLIEFTSDDCTGDFAAAENLEYADEATVFAVDFSFVDASSSTDEMATSSVDQTHTDMIAIFAAFFMSFFGIIWLLRSRN